MCVDISYGRWGGRTLCLIGCCDLLCLLKCGPDSAARLLCFLADPAHLQRVCTPVQSSGFSVDCSLNVTRSNRVYLQNVSPPYISFHRPSLRVLGPSYREPRTCEGLLMLIIVGHEMSSDGSFPCPHLTRTTFAVLLLFFPLLQRLPRGFPGSRSIELQQR